MEEYEVIEEKDSVEYRYEAVKRDLSYKISSGILAEGTRIPSEQELMSRYNVSRITVRRAISELVEDGMLVKKHGVGTFVTRKKHMRHVIGTDSFSTDIRAAGQQPRLMVNSLSYGVPFTRAAETLGFAEGERAIVAECLRFVNDEPVIIEIANFPADCTQLFDKGRSIADYGSISEFVKSRLNRVPANIAYVIELSTASRTEAE
ncbi:MAG: GntR family transcriptional regulator, partial [Clostridia bacterium]|nr:GntR family transcriptional regulator [Clostridia bacterium]